MVIAGDTRVSYLGDATGDIIIRYSAVRINRMWGRSTLFLFGLAAIAAPARAGQQTSGAAASPIDYATARFDRVVEAIRVSGAITLDGRLDELDWERAPIATDFVQRVPIQGALASERTEVRVLYDSSALYVGVFCHDSEPDRIVVKDLRKDFATQENDSVAVMVNGLNDNLSGLTFSANPGGAKFDMQSSQDGDESNADWDGVWDVKTSVNPQGWVAEFAIPYKTLRISREGSQEWGLNVLRRVRRKNEESNWSPIPVRYRMSRASLMGTLKGISGARQGRNLKVKPFAIGGFTEFHSASGLSRDGQGDGGIDVKYGVTPSVTLDLTYRTDFSQAEVDQQQVNLTRFSLFFPEKREFFLENRGSFAVASAPNGSGDSNLIPFFSRRLGLSADGTPIPIVGGARVSGKARNLDVGLLTMRTEAAGSTPTNTFVVGRIAKHLRRNTWIGGLVTSRESSGSGSYNRVYGVDANVRLTDKLEVASFLYRSETPARRGDSNAGLLRALWKGDELTARTQYDILQRNFNPEVGFVRRPDTGHFVAGFNWLPRRTPTPAIQNFVLGHDFNYYATSRGDIYSRQHDFTAGIDLRNGSSIKFSGESTFDRLFAPFRIRQDVAIPAGDYTYERLAVDVISDRSRVLGGTLQFNTGEFWDGTRTSYGGTAEFKPSRHLTVSLVLSRDHVDLPYGAFDATLVGSRVLIGFTSRMFFNTFLQYNADTRQFSSNTRFNIIHRPLSDLFVVFNDRRDTASHLPIDRSFTVKFTNLFDF